MDRSPVSDQVVASIMFIFVLDVTRVMYYGVNDVGCWTKREKQTAVTSLAEVNSYCCLPFTTQHTSVHDVLGIHAL